MKKGGGRTGPPASPTADTIGAPMWVNSRHPSQQFTGLKEQPLREAILLAGCSSAPTSPPPEPSGDRGEAFGQGASLRKLEGMQLAQAKLLLSPQTERLPPTWIGSEGEPTQESRARLALPRQGGPTSTALGLPSGSRLLLGNVLVRHVLLWGILPEWASRPLSRGTFPFLVALLFVCFLPGRFLAGQGR